MDIFWFLPGNGDNRYLNTQHNRRAASFEYLSQVATAVDSLGFTGALVPTGQTCEDAWIAASTLIPVTKRLKFLVAVRPGAIAPTVAARMAATFDRFSGGRLLVNIVTGGDPVELAGDGTFLSHDERYAVSDEFLEIWRGLFTGKLTTVKGEHLHIEGGQLAFPPVQRPYPPLWFGGSSPAAMEVAAKHIDVYLSLGEPPHLAKEKFERMRELAAKQGRTIRFGLRFHIFVREKAEEAWKAAENVLRFVDDEAIARNRAKLQRFDSVGQARTHALVANNREALEVSPNLWMGVGLVNKGVGAALVGDPDSLAERLQEYVDIGADTFILGSYPHLEEAYQVAELLFPRLPGWREKIRDREYILDDGRLPKAW